MAQRTIVTTIDDLDGTEGAETVVFSFKETVYSVDLTVRNQRELLRALAPFITVSRTGFDGDHQATEVEIWQHHGSTRTSFGSERSG